MFCSYPSSFLRGLDAFCTAFLHPCLFSTNHSQSCPSSDVVHPTHFVLPFALPPSMLLCIISFFRLSSFFLIICPKHVSFLILIDSSSYLSVSAVFSTHSLQYFPTKN